MLTHCAMLDAVDPGKACRRVARGPLSLRGFRPRAAAPGRAAPWPAAGPGLRRAQRHKGFRLAAESALVQALTEEELEVAIQERDKPLVIDFYATWCGPCLLLAKELEEVARTLGEAVRIVKLDVDKYPGLSSQLQIQGLPTLVFVGTDRSKPALRTEGLLPASSIIGIIEQDLAQVEAKQA